MERIDIPFSAKNIPVPRKELYETMFIEKSIHLLTRVRWRAWHILNPDKKDTKETYGFPTCRTAPVLKETEYFEKEVLGMIKRIKFSDVPVGVFQKKLIEQASTIRKCKEIIIPADKTSNYYKMDPKEYKKALTESVSKEYKKDKDNTEWKINKEAAKLTKKMELDDRIPVFKKNEAFLTVKDHKEDWPGKVDYRLVNPAKSHVGKISKGMLDKIIQEVKEVKGLNQWKSTGNATDWFKNIENKEEKEFIKWDIVSFYPKITEELFNKALDFESTVVEISDDEREVFKNSHKAMICTGGENWVKKGDSSFDTTIGSLDGAETCELVGLYLLNEVNKILPEGGLYRDDGLAVAKLSGPQWASTEKEMHRMFKENGLQITIVKGMKRTDFLDVVMDLETGMISPFCKPNNRIKYINTQSNHPSNIIKELPNSINSRISAISSNKEIFDREIGTYREALEQAGYSNPDLNFKERKEKSKNRKRKIMWFNPPFSKTVDSDITKMFNAILIKCFPKDNILHKAFNKNNVKISYSCTPNIAQIISSHNKKVMRDFEEKEAGWREKKWCNCRGGEETCPVEGKCQKEGVLYEGKIEVEGENAKKYIGGCATTFKIRWSNHKKSFNHEKHKHDTALSSYFWEKKAEGKNPEITWRLIKSARPYTPESDKCFLCLEEKVLIAKADPDENINKRTEMLAKCRHKAKHLLSAMSGRRR